MTQTILSAKEFLDGELAKYDSWEEVCNEEFFTTLFGNAGNFGKTKKEGVGRSTLQKFLGGNWADHRAAVAFKGGLSC